jgi:phosphoenolpyruvate-protein kinase (PTS system EI component)
MAEFRLIASDIKDISNRIIGCLNPDEKSEEKLTEKVIICADELAPTSTDVTRLSFNNHANAICANV